ncbi:DNA mismatch repair endonuclease MutL [Thalassotalea mangrovi]|uniref:DNA mismatch repair protein MutL n=1 Tax=Thalassotalea mangrovi TaxID=2572245 RepID=A0A4U1B7V2_9GAMM|nr:DNA mismatch repair endonuclease MutL [Thalassotalea mangrovi]TKB46694.1 DNA mismatch repair endonuclease MutL [Thalassotalea mangrovi]
MTIAILPPRLANQIAAGEVVERPASVVKELVENSIDAGATNIIIDIEQGGHKRIRISDNGQGITKDELTLALSRHATSKIKDLDDLESIASLGFRGEALASISSVSRLTLTSKPAAQDNAWQAMATGRDMQVDIQPAAHPDGTTIDVEDLFFNTPARRKFLRTHKTEFSHIDEVVRRIALSKLDVSFALNHNGKSIRQYRRATSDRQVEKRLASICSQAFVDHSIAIDFQHQGLHLYGWVASPGFTRSQNDLCYSYVNGRMMRDKLINHAIRQAYGESLAHDAYPAFVLFLNLDFDQVDVNVHPAKHEVRFHQARLVHDFITSAIAQSLHQQHLDDGDDSSIAAIEEPSPSTDHSEYRQPLRANKPHQFRDSDYSGSVETNKAAGYRPYSGNYLHGKDKPGKQALSNYDRLLTTDITASELYSGNTASDTQTALPVAPFSSSALVGDYQVITLSARHTAVILHQRQLYLLDVMPLIRQYQTRKMAKTLATEVVSQPLLLPVALNFDPQTVNFIEKHSSQFLAHGIHLELKPGGKCIIRQYPAILREQDVQSSFERIINQLQSQGGDEPDWVDCFAQLLSQPVTKETELQSILADLCADKNLDFSALFDLNCLQLDLTSYLDQLKSPSE